MSKLTIKFNRSGFTKVRRSAEVQKELHRRAAAIAEACGTGYVALSGTTRARARAIVMTAGPEAIEDNAKNNTLIRNFDRGRG